MTDLNRFFRAGALAGIVLSSAAVLYAPRARAQQQPPTAMPRPRYQSPGVPAAEVDSPRPQYQLPPTASITPNATVVEDVIVRVNDQIISRSDLERANAQLQQELSQNPGGGDGAERQKNLLRDLIDQQLLISKGKELNINPDAEVVRRLDEIRKQNNFPTLEALETAARSQGVSFEDFKANIRNNIVTSSVVRDEVGRTVSQHMSESEQRKYYEAHKDELAQPEQVRLSEILVPLAANADEAQIAAAQKTSQDIYDKLKGGADFAATAKAQSGGPTAAQGGDLGQFKHGALAAVLEQKTFALPVGGYTEPTRTRQGFVILKATEHQQAGTPRFEQVQNEVQNAMYQEGIQPALRAYLTKQREDSFVDVRPGFVDSGASPKQTKPVFAAYVPPVPKKKTAKQRMEGSGRLENRKGGPVAPAPAVAELDKNGKPKKIRREKVRFGQAPRTALPDAPVDANATETAAGSTAAAPGTAVSPIESSNTVAVNVPDEGDALTPKVENQPKTRFQQRAVEVKERKIKAKTAKVAEKAKATPVAANTTEKQEQNIQADALGLNGSDAVKKKKKRKKGDPKERLQEKPVQQAAPLQDNGLPGRLHQVDGPGKSATDKPKASSDSTTLAPADQPAPGSTLPSQQPSSNGGVTPTSNQPVPQNSTQPQ